jgi:hypothetical protein
VRTSALILFLLTADISFAQTIGGSSTFNFLKLSNTPQLTGLGGVNVSQTSGDVGMAFYNPSLLTGKMHAQMNAVFNDFYAGITAYHLSLGYHNEKLNTNFLWGLHYLNYGSIRETDASGNLYGELHPADWVLHVSAARSYLEKWNYGATLKFISSNYGQYTSNAVAVDAGVLFHDSAKLFSASVLAKNMGFQFKKYSAGGEDLPFDLVAGLTKRFSNAPFGFSITAHHLHQFDIRYNDTSFNNENVFGQNNANKKFGFDKFFRHIVIASQIYIGDKLEVSLGYNHLRRKELSVGEAGNGLNGFSLGVGALFSKIQVRFARAYYQNNTAYNQLGLNLQLNKYFGLGKFGEKIGW